jgi:hypothetical protein
MWRLMVELPTEVVGSAVFTFLSTKGIVQMETALVHAQERVVLFNMVRAGPALDLPRFQSAYQWLRKNNLVAKRCSLDAIDASEHEELHKHVESLSVDGKLHILKKYPQLCEKVSSLQMSYRPSVFAPAVATPGQLLRKLKSFSVDADQCTEAWVLELLQANPALQTLQIKVNIDHPPAQRWFSKAAKLCAGLLDLTLSGLRGGRDEDVLWQVAQHCPALRKLEIYCSPNSADLALPESPMLAIAQQCKQLESIDVNGTVVTSPTVSAICLHCRNLTTLMARLASIASADLLHLLPQHRKQPVTDLECRWALQQESEVHVCAAVFSGLQKLIVTVPAQCEHAFAAASMLLSGLDELDITILSASTPAADTVFFALAERSRLLRRLQVGKGAMSGEAVAALVERNRYLRSFVWWHGSQATSSDAAVYALGRCCPLIERVQCIAVGDAGVQAVAEGCKHLESLIIRDSAITDVALEALSLHCSALDAAIFLDCPHVTEAGLTALVASCRKLRFLRVVHPDIDEAAAVRIMGAHTRCSVHIR